MARNLTIVWWALDSLLFAIGLLGFVFPSQLSRAISSGSCSICRDSHIMAQQRWR